VVACAVLDEMDYPVLLVDAGLELRFGNKAAFGTLQRGRPLRLARQALQAADAGDQAHLLRHADAAVRQRLRALVTLAAGSADETTVAVVPMRSAAGRDAAMLILPKAAVCEDLTLDCWARDRSLTPVETRVLRALCEGQSPDGIAQNHGVALSTVRTQIGALRAKLGAKDLRALTRKVAMLPPLVGALRPRPALP
jgi:DNA-binding CsgD family transcriptional regulator